jgi:heme-degrading monooxygenase HmoA
MYARVSTYEGTSESVERSLAQGDELVPLVRGMQGSRGVLLLVDRDSGREVSITLWEDEDAMRASEQAADRLRRDSAASSGQTIASVDRYEVALLDVPRPS